MSGKVEGGIIEHQDLVRFTASSNDIAPKDQIDLMARNWFSLTPNRIHAIEHIYEDARTGCQEIVRITGSAEHGIATIHDQDLLIFVISQWIEAKQLDLEISRRIRFMPYQLFAWLGIEANGTSYRRVREALNRLRTTSIETTVRSQVGKRTRNRIKQFSWISEWAITEEDGEIRGIEVVLAEWLFESIQNFHVLTLDKRYFGIHGGVERWLYLYARKATGGAEGIWKETFKSLYRKSASQQAYKHFANTLRKLVKKNDLPGFRLETARSKRGEDMLLMERAERHQEVKGRAVAPEPEQIPLFERSPLEEAWENVLETLDRRLGTGEVNSWLKNLFRVSFQDGCLAMRAPTEFIASYVAGNYKSKLIAAWKKVGYAVLDISFEVKSDKKAAA